jgi:hypothetical protein
MPKEPVEPTVQAPVKLHFSHRATFNNGNQTSFVEFEISAKDTEEAEKMYTKMRAIVATKPVTKPKDEQS